MAKAINAAYRWPDDVKQQIKARAAHFGMTETDFVREAALSWRPGRGHAPGIAGRLDDLERRMAALEHWREYGHS